MPDSNLLNLIVQLPDILCGYLSTITTLLEHIQTIKAFFSFRFELEYVANVLQQHPMTLSRSIFSLCKFNSLFLFTLYILCVCVDYTKCYLRKQSPQIFSKRVKHPDILLHLMFIVAAFHQQHTASTTPPSTNTNTDIFRTHSKTQHAPYVYHVHLINV